MKFLNSTIQVKTILALILILLGSCLLAFSIVVAHLDDAPGAALLGLLLSGGIDIVAIHLLRRK